MSSIETLIYLNENIGSRSCLNDAGDKSLSRCMLDAVNTLSARIEWILENCRREDGTKWDGKSLSLAAGLSQGHVGQIKRGTLKEPGSAVLAAIASTARVDAGWLLTGSGAPTGLPTTNAAAKREERYPNRRVAAESLDGLVEPEATAQVLQWNLYSTDDQTPQWWAERIKEVDRKLKAHRADPALAERERAKRLADTADLERRIEESKGKG